jgi:signal transduction histidine kinase
MFGYTAEEMIGQPIYRIIPEERRTEEEQILARLRNSERIQDLETVRMTKAGRRVEVSVTISPSTYPNLRPETADICIPPILPSLIGSRAALTQVFSNLLGNAVKFVKPGVRPRVIIRAEADNLSDFAFPPDNLRSQSVL